MVVLGGGLFLMSEVPLQGLGFRVQGVTSWPFAATCRVLGFRVMSEVPLL